MTFAIKLNLVAKKKCVPLW